MRAHRWRVSKLGPITKIDGQGVWYAKEFTFPELSATTETVQGAGIDYKYAGQTQFGPASLVLYDASISEGTSLLLLLTDWVRKVHATDVTTAGRSSVVGRVAIANEYKDRSIFEMTSNTGSKLYSITLHGSWPSKLTHSVLNYSSSEICDVNLELTYDWYTSSGTGGGRNDSPITQDKSAGKAGK